MEISQKKGQKMRDIFEILHEASEEVSNQKEVSKLFAEKILKELKSMDTEEFTSHFECIADKFNCEYRIILTFPMVSSNIFPIQERMKVDVLKAVSEKAVGIDSVDKTIETICNYVQRLADKRVLSGRTELIRALAELVTARNSQPKIDIDELGERLFEKINAAIQM